MRFKHGTMNVSVTAILDTIIHIVLAIGLYQVFSSTREHSWFLTKISSRQVVIICSSKKQLLLAIVEIIIPTGHIWSSQLKVWNGPPHSWSYYIYYMVLNIYTEQLAPFHLETVQIRHRLFYET